jgi:hypothetical protein
LPRSALIKPVHSRLELQQVTERARRRRRNMSGGPHVNIGRSGRGYSKTAFDRGVDQMSADGAWRSSSPMTKWRRPALESQGPARCHQIMTAISHVECKRSRAATPVMDCGPRRSEHDHRGRADGQRHSVVSNERAHADAGAYPLGPAGRYPTSSCSEQGR